MTRASLWVVVIGVAVMGCGDDDGGGSGSIATTETLRAELAAATPGQTLTLAAGTFEGPFDVPAGVTLLGAGRDQTRIHAAAEQIALRVRGGAGRTVLRALTVVSDGRAGVLAIGADELELAEVTVTCTGPGVAIGVEDTALVVANDVAVTGPVMRADPTAAEALAASGFVLVDVGRAQLGNVTARAFVDSGLTAIRTALEWTGGGVSDGLGQGISVFGGSATLTDLRVADQIRFAVGVQRSTYGIAATGGAMLDTEGVTVEGIDGFGLYHGEATALHTVLDVSGGTNTSVLLERGADVTIRGATISDGLFAAIAAVGASQLVVEDAMLEGIGEATRPSDTFGAVTVGDGIHVVESETEQRLANLRLERVVLADNARVGFLADLGGMGSTSVLSFADVVVRGPESGYGALAQNGEIAEGWDTGLVREGALSTRDVGAPSMDTAPPLRAGDLPAFPGSDDDGIAGIIGPID